MAETSSKTAAKPTAKSTVKPAVKAVPKAAAKSPAKASVVKAKPVAVPIAAKKPAAAKPAIPAVAKATAKKPAAVKDAPKAKAPNKGMLITDEQRYRMVAEAAYYRAESNQFKSDPLRDWIEAESDIAALLSGSK